MRHSSLLGLFLGLAATASAQLLVFDLSSSPLVIGPDSDVQVGAISLAGAGSYTVGTGTSPSFYIYNFDDFGGLRVGMSGDANLNLALDSGYIARFESGETIDDSIGSWTVDFADGYLVNDDNGSWAGGGDAYVGARLGSEGNYSYGWLHAVYNSATSTLTVDSFAFGTTLNQAVAAGISAVPEPSTYAAMAGMGVLLLAVWRRRAARMASA